MEKNKKTKSSLNDSLTMLGLTAGLSSMMMGIIGGGLDKMFGSKDITVRELVTGMIDGFQVYIEEQREKLDEKNKEIQDLQIQLAQKAEHYEEMSEAAEKLRQEVSIWKSKYMKLVSNSRTRPKKK